MCEVYTDSEETGDILLINHIKGSKKYTTFMCISRFIAILLFDIINFECIF